MIFNQHGQDTAPGSPNEQPNFLPRVCLSVPEVFKFSRLEAELSAQTD